MIDNDVIILDNAIRQWKKGVADEYDDSEVFELFTFEQILKNYDFSYEELNHGKVGGSDDGGIDGFYFMVDGELLTEKIDVTAIKRKPILELFIIQSKQSRGFSEEMVDKILSTSLNLFDFTKDMRILETLLNPVLIEKAEIFRETYLELTARHPELRIRILFATKGDGKNINPKVKEKTKNLEDVLIKLLPGADVESRFVGARELLELFRLEKKYNLTLSFTESFSKGKDNYVVLVSLSDYYKFIVDEENKLRRYIFESNVRDFQGYVEVNQDIDETLKGAGEIDFWWLNNGITILASEASVAGKAIALDNVQIINGLQTTNCIFNYMTEKYSSVATVDAKDSNRFILIKILVINVTATRDKIIKATNFQTSISPASLRATETIHEDLEEYFLSKDWYYDRRKNYYKNLGKPSSRIISIPFLAQAIKSILLKEPHIARAKPSSLVKNEVDYKRIFSSSVNPDVYLFCGRCMRQIEIEMKKEIQDFSYQEKTNLKLHVGLVLMKILTGKHDWTLDDVHKIADQMLSEDKIDEAIKKTILLSRKYLSENKTSIERMAKSKAFADYLIRCISE